MNAREDSEVKICKLAQKATICTEEMENQQIADNAGSANDWGGKKSWKPEEATPLWTLLQEAQHLGVMNPSQHLLHVRRCPVPVDVRSLPPAGNSCSSQEEYSVQEKYIMDHKTSEEGMST